MRVFNQKKIEIELDKLQLKTGDNVLIFSDIVSIGRVSEFKTRDEYCSFYYNLIREKIGDAGTIVVPTYTPDVARFDVLFDRLATKSQNGVFSEYLRNFDGAHRSDHPLNSVTAIGPNSKLFCAKLGTTNFGWNSPFHKMHEADIKIISMGTCPGVCLGIAHYIEAVCCLPYVYNKLLKWPSYSNGIRDPRPFFASVRHLNLKYRLNYTQWSKKLYALNVFEVSRLGASFLAQTQFGIAFETAVNELAKNPYFLLDAEPNFVFGELPFDGPTIDRELKNAGGSINRLQTGLSYDNYLDPGTVEQFIK